MAQETSVRDRPQPVGVTISFGERFASSEQFTAIFKEGMSLVDRTAAYLDGEGRKDARRLGQPLAAIYATESMRLTTRLLEIASWLLITRAVKEGEISAEEAGRKRRQVKLRTFGRPAHIKNFADLPAGLRNLIEHSFALNDRIMQLDRAIEAQVASRTGATVNPVAQQLATLHAAFGSGARAAAE